MWPPSCPKRASTTSQISRTSSAPSGPTRPNPASARMVRLVRPNTVSVRMVRLVRPNPVSVRLVRLVSSSPNPVSVRLVRLVRPSPVSVRRTVIDCTVRPNPVSVRLVRARTRCQVRMVRLVRSHPVSVRLQFVPTRCRSAWFVPTRCRFLGWFGWFVPTRPRGGARRPGGDGGRLACRPSEDRGRALRTRRPHARGGGAARDDGPPTGIGSPAHDFGPHVRGGRSSPPQRFRGGPAGGARPGGAGHSRRHNRRPDLRGRSARSRPPLRDRRRAVLQEPHRRRNPAPARGTTP